MDRPLASLQLVLASGGLLLAIGLVMVLSASMWQSYVKFGTTYEVFARQLMWVGVGLPAFWLGLRLPPRAYRLLAYPALLGSLALLCLVLLPQVGETVYGARRWIDLGSVQLQPSEPAKFALALWGADLLVRKQRMLGRLRHLALPLVPVCLLFGGLVMLEPDLGSTLCLVLVLTGLLWTVGAPGRFFGMLVVLAGAMVAMLIYVEPYRLARFTAFLDPFQDPTGSGLQAVRGLYSLSTGGWFGVGLGQSRMKWGLLPNAHTDYIFAILGEELGLVGSLVVLVLFATLAYAGIRIARRTDDPFVRLASAAVTTWITGQALINMGYVSGLLPVTGIPLPLISFGGTSLVVTLFAVGMLASFARHEPAAVVRLSQRGRLSRLLALPAPKRYVERASRRSRRPARRPARRSEDRSAQRSAGGSDRSTARSGAAREHAGRTRSGSSGTLGGAVRSGTGAGAAAAAKAERTDRLRGAQRNALSSSATRSAASRRSGSSRASGAAGGPRNGSADSPLPGSGVTRSSSPRRVEGPHR